MAIKEWVRAAACPNCKHIGELRPIVYGMPGPEFDFEAWEVGGCCITNDMPEVACRACEWSGTSKSVRTGTP